MTLNAKSWFDKEKKSICTTISPLKPTLSVPSLKAHIEVLMLLAVKRVDGCHKLSQRSVEAQQLLKGQFQQPAP